MNRLIIASAAYFETAELVASLRKSGCDVTQVITGVGLVESAIVASRLNDLVRDRDVIFCCTGGILGSFTDVQIYQASSVKLAPQDVRAGDSYLLYDFEPEIQLNGPPLALPKCIAAGSVGISLVESHERSKPPTLETLELYSVSRAWSPMARSLTGIVAATNAVGPHAHQNWIKNFKHAAHLTAKTISQQVLTEELRERFKL